MGAEYTSTGRDRGICAVCGREYEITKKGLVRLHRRVIASRGAVKTAGCRGGGEPPRA
ncbi:hypothetical protein [Micromonospora tarensis]|uniref:ROS/MUCR transcriptional regulator protein n=1 Tax=Micromonospora tarensis TaxID=2806100 RepID=A0ABS1YQG1_9ACTN|nr:hypothetical protein [Micromonospora tarensis]MBM0279675.1 hypothetical protein [Micromonospora tarensis]